MAKNAERFIIGPYSVSDGGRFKLAGHDPDGAIKHVMSGVKPQVDKAKLKGLDAARVALEGNRDKRPKIAQKRRRDE